MVQVNPQMSRRERIFSDTQAELSAAARDLVVAGGTEAVTLRAVASALGMTAPAVYRYFESREKLLERVIADLYVELAGFLRATRDDPANTGTLERLVATSRAFRAWAMEHQPEFGLLFGAPIPGVALEQEETDHAEGMDFGRVWFEMFIEIDRRGKDLAWSGPMSEQTEAAMFALADKLQVPVNPRATYLYLYCWQSLYGAVCTEVFGHLKWAVEDAEELFEGRLAELAGVLGFDPADIPPRAAVE